MSCLLQCSYATNRSFKCQFQTLTKMVMIHLYIFHANASTTMCSTKLRQIWSFTLVCISDLNIAPTSIITTLPVRTKVSYEILPVKWSRVRLHRLWPNNGWTDFYNLMNLSALNIGVNVQILLGIIKGCICQG